MSRSAGNGRQRRDRPEQAAGRQSTEEEGGDVTQEPS